MKYLKNKRGILLPETLRMIIAWISIILLVVFVIALYIYTAEDRELEEAQATLTNSSGSIKAAIERVRMEVSSNETILVNNPLGWNIFTFVGENKKPNFCAGENCICICDNVLVDDLFGVIDSRQLTECDEDGVCLIVSDLQNKEISKAISPGITLTIKKLNELILIE
jgi:hypothetical protein